MTYGPAPDGRSAPPSASILPEAAEDPAWLNVTAWQGGGLVVHRLAAPTAASTGPPSRSRSTATGRPRSGFRRPRDPRPPRLHARGHRHPRPDGAGEAFLHPPVRRDHELLQRERKGGVPGWLTTVAPLGVLALALVFLTTLALGLGRLARRTAERRRRRGACPAPARDPSPSPPALGREQERPSPSGGRPARPPRRLPDRRRGTADRPPPRDHLDLGRLARDDGAACRALHGRRPRPARPRALGQAPWRLLAGRLRQRRAGPARRPRLRERDGGGPLVGGRHRASVRVPVPGVLRAAGARLQRRARQGGPPLAARRGASRFGSWSCRSSPRLGGACGSAVAEFLQRFGVQAGPDLAEARAATRRSPIATPERLSCTRCGRSSTSKASE